MHHTNADFVERIEPDALKQAAVVTATVRCHAAMRDQKVPRWRLVLPSGYAGANTRTV